MMLCTPGVLFVACRKCNLPNNLDIHGPRMLFYAPSKMRLGVRPPPDFVSHQDDAFECLNCGARGEFFPIHYVRSDNLSCMRSKHKELVDARNAIANM